MKAVFALADLADIAFRAGMSGTLTHMEAGKDFGYFLQWKL